MTEVIEQPIVIPQAEFDIAKHNGMVTVHNPATGNHRTFKISTRQSGDLKDKRIVSLLTGPDRENYKNWCGFAFVNEDGSVKVWNRFKNTVYAKYARMLKSPEVYIALGAEFMVEGRCRKCNRALTHPESIQTGIGPVCGGREE
jgi:hypothetical protein